MLYEAIKQICKISYLKIHILALDCLFICFTMRITYDILGMCKKTLHIYKSFDDLGKRLHTRQLNSLFQHDIVEIICNKFNDLSKEEHQGRVMRRTKTILLPKLPIKQIEMEARGIN